MADTATVRARNATFWTQAAPGWIRHADRHDAWGRPMGAVAMDWLLPRAGERILDVGCGCGGTSAELATAVGPTGAVTGVDVAAPMVAAAVGRFPPNRFANLRFIAADVEALATVAGSPFDAVYSRMALMMLADPVADCATILRALRPGGRLAATVFRDGGASPWLHATLLGAAPHLGSLPPLPIGDEPGPFAFADRERTIRILTEAGFGSVSVEPHDVTLYAADDPDTTVEWLIELGPAGAAYRTALAGQQQAARGGAARLLSRFRQPDSGYQLSTGIWLVTAARTS
jgi:SAM-dependent methyltransferase